jgi:type IV pilus assembly protein PilY1
MGEWNNTTITCVSNPTAQSREIPTALADRRLHDGRWAVIFGNGFGSATGDAGIFVMTLDPTNGASGAQIYYLSTGQNTATTGSPNGIAYATPADFDGDHVADFVYAGDLHGNVWRFDLTDPNEANWMVTPGPLFNTGGLPITTQVVVASGAPTPGQQQQIMVLFGTGLKNPISNASAATYATGTQNLYGVWDWNQSASDGGRLGPGTGNPQRLGWPVDRAVRELDPGHCRSTTLTSANLQQQIVTINSATQNRDINVNATICWTGGCPLQTARQFGWYLNLPGSQEQIIFSPELVAQALTVNSIVPAINSARLCSNNSDTGFTYVLSAMTGGAFNTVFLPPSEAANPAVAAQAAYQDVHAIAMQTNATGSSFITGNSTGTQYLVFETNQVESGTGANGNNILGGTLGLNLPPNTTGRRLSWIELR